LFSEVKERLGENTGKQQLLGNSFYILPSASLTGYDKLLGKTPTVANNLLRWH
jgi:hypothetical protein